LPKNFLQQQIFFGYCGNIAKHKNEQIAFAKGTTFKNKISELLNIVFSFGQCHFFAQGAKANSACDHHCYFMLPVA
jgi:hypothetical protein